MLFDLLHDSRMHAGHSMILLTKSGHQRHNQIKDEVRRKIEFLLPSFDVQNKTLRNQIPSTSVSAVRMIYKLSGDSIFN